MECHCTILLVLKALYNKVYYKSYLLNFHNWLIFNSVLNVKAVVASFNQEKALVGAFSGITNLRMELFEALVLRCEEKGEGGDHLLGILFGTRTGTRPCG